MKKEEKRKIIEEVKELIDKSEYIYLLTFSGISANELGTIRNKMKKGGIRTRWVKNSLLRKALNESSLSHLIEKIDRHLSGPTLVAFSESPSTPVRILSEWNTTEGFKFFKAAIINGELVSGQEGFNYCLRLRSKSEILGGLILILKSQLARILNGLKEHAEKREEKKEQ